MVGRQITLARLKDLQELWKDNPPAYVALGAIMGWMGLKPKRAVVDVDQMIAELDGMFPGGSIQ